MSTAGEQAKADGTPAGTRWVERVLERFRDPNPILVRELRSVFRTKLFIRFLYLSTGVIGFIVLLAGVGVASSSMPPAEVGRVLFQVFFSATLFVLSLVAPAYAATAFTSEREQRTYESLILSGMAPWRIVRGKFLSIYAAMFLVLVAQAPVVGVVFLFGGISPWHVLAGFIGLLYALAPAVAFGLAVSARLSSTRIAILVATLVFVPIAFFGTLSSAGLGEAARTAWGNGMQGPFWFAEAVVNRFFEPDTFALLGILPLYLVGVTVWFFLASAVAGIRPAADDRSTPFKIWSLVSGAGTVVILGLLVLLWNSAHDAAEGAVAFAVGSFGILLFYALLFANEEPLPPRLAATRKRVAPMRWLFHAFGPGAAPTVRFGLLFVVVLSLAIPASMGGVRWLRWSPGVGDTELALGVVALGHAAIAAAVLTVASWLRLVLKNAVAARALTVTALFLGTVVPFLLAVVIDPSALDQLDRRIAFFLQISPLMPAILGVNLVEENMGPTTAVLVTVPVVVYGLVALLFMVLVELKVRAARRLDEERRAQREARLRASSPPPRPLQEGEVRAADPMAADATAAGASELSSADGREVEPSATGPGT